LTELRYPEIIYACSSDEQKYNNVCLLWDPWFKMIAKYIKTQCEGMRYPLLQLHMLVTLISHLSVDGGEVRL